jgi:hypothetical protein
MRPRGVSTGSHGRRLDAKERRRRSSGRSSGEAYIAAVYEADRLRDEEKAAATAMAGFAQALAGTVMQPRAREHGSPETRPTARDTKPERLEPPSERRRPRHDEILTWDEAMQIPWHDGNLGVDLPLPAPRPSYGGEPEE